MCPDAAARRWPTLVVWRTAAMSPAMYTSLLAALPAARRQEIAALRAQQARHMAAGASLLLYWALANRRRLPGGVVVCPCARDLSSFLDGGLPAELAAAVDWRRGVHGKPMPGGVILPDGRWHGSLSHSEGMAGVAIAREPVGFDLQGRRPLPDDRMRRIADRLHPKEAAALRALPADALTIAFWQWWAFKESVLKLTGEGLTRPLSSFCIERGPDGYAALVAGRPVCLQPYAAPEGWKAALAAAVYATNIDDDSGAPAACGYPTTERWGNGQ